MVQYCSMDFLFDGAPTKVGIYFVWTDTKLVFHVSKLVYKTNDNYYLMRWNYMFNKICCNDSCASWMLDPYPPN